MAHAEEMVVQGLWHGGYKFLACWNGNRAKNRLQEIRNRNAVVVSRDGERIEALQVVRFVIESAEMPNYSIVILSPDVVQEFRGEDGDEVYSFTHKAQELMNLYNLSPAKSSMTIPKPFSNYRKTAYKMVETLDDVMALVRLGGKLV